MEQKKKKEKNESKPESEEESKPESEQGRQFKKIKMASFSILKCTTKNLTNFLKAFLVVATLEIDLTREYLNMDLTTLRLLQFCLAM